MKRISLALLALWISTAAIAQDELKDSELELLADSAASESTEKLTLRLTDAVAMGIENNLGLQVERFDPLIAFEDQETAWGAFDPTFSAETGYAKDFAQNPNVLLGNARTRTRGWDAKTGVQTILPYIGASLGIELTGQESNTTQFNRFQTIRPQYDSGLALTGTLPLLKGLVWSDPWTRVKTSRSAYRGSLENFRTSLMDVVQTIETQYWDVVAQGEGVRVGEKSLETARSLLDQTQTQYDVGVKSKVEVVESEAGVAAREFDLITATNLYRRAQDRLIDSVLGTQLSAASNVEVQPADDPENYIEYQVDVAEAANKALASRPELAAAQSEIVRNEYQLKFAKNSRLPQLDFQANYGVGGLRGEGFGTFDDDANPVTPEVSNPDTGNFGDTFNDWFTRDGSQNYGFRGVFSVPIGNIAGRHGVSKSELELRKAHTRLIRLRQDIILEVRDGARNLKSAQEGIQAAERRRLAAEEQLRAENVRLEYGESTPFKVLEKEEDLVEAENAKIAALFTYRKSVVDLDRAQGTILKTRNIVVDEAASLR